MKMVNKSKSGSQLSDGSVNKAKAKSSPKASARSYGSTTSGKSVRIGAISGQTGMTTDPCDIRKSSGNKSKPVLPKK